MDVNQEKFKGERGGRSAGGIFGDEYFLEGFGVKFLLPIPEKATEEPQLSLNLQAKRK